MMKVKPGIWVLWLAPMGCTVADGDLASSAALVGLDVTASEDTLDGRTTQVTGEIELGYTSEQRVELQILDNGVVVYSAAMDASNDLQHTIETPVDLLFEGANVLAVNVRYHDESITASIPLTVAGALQAFTLTPAATAVTVFSVDVSGLATAGYMSDSPATLSVSVDGAPVFADTFDLSSTTTAAISADIPLGHTGANEIVAELSYAGALFTKAFGVTVEAPDPTPLCQPQ